MLIPLILKNYHQMDRLMQILCSHHIAVLQCAKVYLQKSFQSEFVHGRKLGSTNHVVSSGMMFRPSFRKSFTWFEVTEESAGTGMQV
jgi:hypothetical protein